MCYCVYESFLILVDMAQCVSLCLWACFWVPLFLSTNVSVSVYASTCMCVFLERERDQYIHMHIHAEWITRTQWQRTSEDFFNKIGTSHFIVRVRKGLLRVLLWEGAGDRTELQYFAPHSYGRQRCVFPVLLMLNQRPGGSALCWMMAFFTASYQQFLWTNNSSGVPRAPSAWRGFPYHITSLTPTHQKGPLRRAFSTTSCL